MKELRKIVRQVLKEYVSRSDLQSVENYADSIFSDVGIDVAFTKHFLDRVNDPRNIRDITPEELKALYAKAREKYGNTLSKLPPGSERVVNDTQTDINVPVAIGWDGKSPDKDMVAKTVMRKKNFKTSETSPKLTLEIIDEAVGRIKKVKLNGTFYHGTSIGSDDELFSEISPSYSDWEASWFSSEESISEEFADNTYRDENEVKVVYKVNLQCAPIAVIDYNQYKNIMNDWALDDFREAIPILISKGLRGWKTTGSIGSRAYEDIAIFSSHCIKIEGVKLFLNNKWTNYMTLEKAQALINAHRGIDEDINVPINVGDEVLGGKFKNKKITVKSISKNDKGDITINDKPLLRFRIKK